MVQWQAWLHLYIRQLLMRLRKVNTGINFLIVPPMHWIGTVSAIM